MKSTSFLSSEVRMPAKSPGLSSTGPLVILKPTPSSLAMMLLSVVLPSPGGPCSRVWSSGSPRYLAASTNTSRFSTTFFCPLKSPKCSGRRAFSNSLSAADGCSCLMSKSASIVSLNSLSECKLTNNFPHNALRPRQKWRRLRPMWETFATFVAGKRLYGCGRNVA